MTIVVSGVSGNTGRAAAEALLDAGHHVRVVVRDAAKAAPFASRGAEVAVADLADPVALAAALRGASSAYLLVPPNFATGDFRAYQRTVVASLAAAVRDAALPHLVLLSSVGAQHPAGTGPIAGLHEAEVALAATQAKTTFLRPCYFAENLGSSLGALADGVFPTFLPASLPIEMVATKDIGAKAAELLAAGAASPDVVELAGPSPVSSDDVVAMLRTITGREVKALQADVAGMAAALAGHGMPKDLAALYQEMTEGMIRGHVAFEGRGPLARGTIGVGEVLRGLLAS